MFIYLLRNAKNDSKHAFGYGRKTLSPRIDNKNVIDTDNSNNKYGSINSIMCLFNFSENLSSNLCGRF